MRAAVRCVGAAAQPRECGAEIGSAADARLEALRRGGMGERVAVRRDEGATEQVREGRKRGCNSKHRASTIIKISSIDISKAIFFTVDVCTKEQQR